MCKKRKNFDGTALVCCTVGMFVSVGISSWVNTQSEDTRETAKREEVPVLQIQLIQQEPIEELQVPDALAQIQEQLFDKKQEINLGENRESEDSYNAEYEQELAEETANASDEGVEDVELEEENSILTSRNGYSESDYELLSEITYAEAGNQTEEQQVATAATILNRVESNIFPNTIKEVIMQKGQFASTRNGHIYACGKTVDFSKVPDVTKEAARRALNGEDPTENWLRKEAQRLGLSSEKYASAGALYFYSPEYTSSSELAARTNIKCKVQKGGHVFYKVWG